MGREEQTAAAAAEAGGFRRDGGRCWWWCCYGGFGRRSYKSYSLELPLRIGARTGSRFHLNLASLASSLASPLSLPLPLCFAAGFFLLLRFAVEMGLAGERKTGVFSFFSYRALKAGHFFSPSYRDSISLEHRPTLPAIVFWPCSCRRPAFRG